MEYSPQSLGQTIRQRRIELGLTQEELAERIGDGVRQSEVSRLERDRILLPRRERLERIAEAIQMTVGELLAQSGWAGASFPRDEGHATEASPRQLAQPIRTTASDLNRLRWAIMQAEFNCAQAKILLARIASPINQN